MNDNLIERHLLINFTAGTNPETGKDIKKTKTFKNVRLEATESNLADFSTKYAALTLNTHQRTLVANYHDISSL